MTQQNLPVTVPFLGQMQPLGGAWRSEGGVLQAETGPRTDHFVSPDRTESGAGGPRNLTSSALLTLPEARDYVFSARVAPQFAGAFDAGTLFLYVDEERWAKLCFEADPNVKPTVVSVVNRKFSDDATAFEIDAAHVWLRISRMGTAFAFHVSRDGKFWEFLRFFNLAGEGEAVQVGFGAQSPVGEGCTVTFDEISLEYRTLEQLRDGT